MASGDLQSSLAALLAEAVPLREALLGEAEALGRRSLLHAGAVAEIRSGQGNVDKANDLHRRPGG